VDRKGRVSVPAQFRAALTEQPQVIVAYRSFQGPWIEASGLDRMSKFAEELETLDETSERYEFVAAILADARQLGWDETGRLVLPQDLMVHAGIGEEAAFVGQGKFFHIRNPEQQRGMVESAIARRAKAAGGAA
jgi:MraZ protein